MTLPEHVPAPTGLDQLRRSLDGLDTQRQALADAGDLDTLAVGLAQLKPLLTELSTLRDAIEADVAALMPEPRHEVPGLGVLERRRGSVRRSWDWDHLLPLLVRSYVDPDGTGEIPEAGEVVERLRALITEVIGVTPSKGPRITALRERGVDPDEHCESRPGKTSVQIHGGEQ